MMGKGPIKEPQRTPTSLEFGSIPKSAVKPVTKDGIRRINGRQVNLLLALGADAGLKGDRLLEFLEFNCDCKVDRLEDVPDGAVMQHVVAKLKGGEVR